MKKALIFAALAAALALGCGGDDHEGHDMDNGHDAMDAGQTEVEKALSALSAEDRRLAEAQETCAVSDEPLGSMGTPVKVMVEGTPVFLCCEGCRKTLLKDPEKYRAKVSK